MLDAARRVRCGSRCALRDRRHGFTLIEIMVVVIVLGILAATIIPKVANVSYDAKVSKARSNIAVLKSALERFYLNVDRYPTSQEGLEALVKPPAGAAQTWRGPYVEEIIPDPWGNAYEYRNPGSRGAGSYDLWSNGADGAVGGEGKNADVYSSPSESGGNDT